MAALFFFCPVVLPTRCLLDVSRLLGLTLRPSAPVYRCHRDSFTRGRLALAQESVRGPPPFFSLTNSKAALVIYLFVRC